VSLEGEEVRVSVRVWGLAGVAALALAGGSSAQQPASSFFTGVPASQIRNVQVDTSKALVGRPAQSALTSNRFDFTALFSRRIVPEFPTKRGVSPLPSPSSFPSTKYQPFKLVGTPPYPLAYMFGGSNSSPLQPVPPTVQQR
jgi:hypothetical protein